MRGTWSIVLLSICRRDTPLLLLGAGIFVAAFILLRRGSPQHQVGLEFGSH
jgi:hypothetical protein